MPSIISLLSGDVVLRESPEQYAWIPAFFKALQPAGGRDSSYWTGKIIHSPKASLKEYSGIRRNHFDCLMRFPALLKLKSPNSRFA